VLSFTDLVHEAINSLTQDIVRTPLSEGQHKRPSPKMKARRTEWSRSDEAIAVEQHKASLRQLQGVGGCVEISAKQLEKKTSRMDVTHTHFAKNTVLVDELD
jgi:hypothetical protein